MNMGRLSISFVLACSFLGSLASAVTTALTPVAAQAAPSDPNKAFLEDNPTKLKTFSCQALDEAMAMNYNLACLMETTGNAIDNAVGNQAAQKFKVQQKEYKSRCKGKPAKLAEAKRSRSHRRCKSLPNI